MKKLIVINDAEFQLAKVGNSYTVTCSDGYEYAVSSWQFDELSDIWEDGNDAEYRRLCSEWRRNAEVKNMEVRGGDC